MSFILFQVPTFKDERGSLSILEEKMPFSVARMYWIYSADKKVRGGHRHYQTTQALIAVCGQVDIYMNDGVHQETICLNQPNQCLIVAPKDWHTMTFGAGAVLLVLASHPYNVNDYIDEPYAI